MEERAALSNQIYSGGERLTIKVSVGCVNNSSCLCQHCLGFLETRLASTRSVLPSLTVSSRGRRQHRVLLEFPAVFLSCQGGIIYFSRLLQR